MRAIFCLILLLSFAQESLAQGIETPPNDVGYSRALLNVINRYRLDSGLNLLRFDSELQQLAEKHSRMMFEAQQTSHRNFDDRVAQVQSRLCVENVGWNYSLPQQMFEGWQQSSGHNRNLINKNLKRAGIAVIGRYVTFFACE